MQTIITSNGSELQAIIHTIQIESFNSNLQTNIPEYAQGAVKTTSTIRKNQKVYKAIINLNQISGRISQYSKFQKVLSKLIEDMGVDDWTLKRCDVSVDSFEKDDFKKYQKIHKLIISCLAKKIKVRNRYSTSDMFNVEKVRSDVLKTSHLQTESYDKEFETHGTDEATSRFELRTINSNINLCDQEFKTKWKNRYLKALDSFDETLDKYNKELLENYNNLSVNLRNTSFLHSFLFSSRNNIFTHEQLVKLIASIENIGYEEANKIAEYHQRKYTPQLLSKTAVKKRILQIFKAVDKYFDE